MQIVFAYNLASLRRCRTKAASNESRCNTRLARRRTLAPLLLFFGPPHLFAPLSCCPTLSALS